MSDEVPAERPAERAEFRIELPSGWESLELDEVPALAEPEQGFGHRDIRYRAGRGGRGEPRSISLRSGFEGIAEFERWRQWLEEHHPSGRIIEFDHGDQVLRSWSFDRALPTGATTGSQARGDEVAVDTLDIVAEGLTLESADGRASSRSEPTGAGLGRAVRLAVALVTSGAIAVAVLLVLAPSPEAPAEPTSAAASVFDSPVPDFATPGGGAADPGAASPGATQPSGGGMAVGAGEHHYMSEPYGSGTRSVTIQSGTDWWYEALLGTEPPTLDGSQAVCDYEATLAPVDGSRQIPVLDVTGIAETYTPPVQGDLGDLNPGDYELVVDTGPRCGWQISLYAGSAVPRGD